jgi:predicted polyphosphate/ATP-dependent NAD kinase
VSRPLRLGLIVNPLAGLGGRVGLKGTDGLRDAALALGAEPVAEPRALRTLQRLGNRRAELVILAAGGAMGQQVAGKAGLLCELVASPIGAMTSAADTILAARAMQASAVDLILFAGGDGTARDVFSAVGDAVPILGIPAGVKMQSAVFAATPEAAGDIVTAIAAASDQRAPQYRASEVMDIDEDDLRNGTISPRLFGYARVPHIPRLLQNAKVRNHGLDEGALDAAARHIADGMAPEILYAVGAGRSAKRVLDALGLSGSLLGTDLVLDRALVGHDVGERTILDGAKGRALRIVVGVIGGQGYVFGRGNQEISPAVIRLAGRDGITILASQQKLLALEDKRLLVDTGDPDLDRSLTGYWRITVGPREDMMMKVEAPGL